MLIKSSMNAIVKISFIFKMAVVIVGISERNIKLHIKMKLLVRLDFYANVKSKNYAIQICH